MSVRFRITKSDYSGEGATVGVPYFIFHSKNIVFPTFENILETQDILEER